MIFSNNIARLIIGETSALYSNGTECIVLKNPEDLSMVTPPSTIRLYTDFPGATYRTQTYPKLSRFEVRAAIQNHPSLQEKDLLAASARITEKGELNLATLKNSTLLSTWLQALAQQGIPLELLDVLPFYQEQQHPSKSLYHISRTHDNRARHTCFIDGAISFVRYTHFDKDIESEINKTTQFIQRDYALEIADIHVHNDVNQQDAPLALSKDKTFHWDWIERLPKDLYERFKSLHQKQHFQKISHGSRGASIGLFAGTSIFFLSSVFTYFGATLDTKNITQSMSALPASLQKLPLKKLQQIAWFDQNIPSPFKAINTLQKQGDRTLKLEDFHWQQASKNTQRLRLSIKHHQQQRQQDRQDHLEMLFKTPPKALPSDGHVDRFELILTEKESSQ